MVYIYIYKSIHCSEIKFIELGTIFSTTLKWMYSLQSLHMGKLLGNSYLGSQVHQDVLLKQQHLISVFHLLHHQSQYKGLSF